MYKILSVSLIFIVTLNLCQASFYNVLGISKHASTQEIRQAFKKLAVKLHPDKNANEDEKERFLKITEAYETLKDPEKRQQYDIYGSHQHSHTKRYDHESQTRYNELFVRGLYYRDPYVESLTPSTYRAFFGQGYVFINFYSPFCPPCQNLADDWKKLAEIYKGVVKVGAVNCKYYNSFCYNTMRIGNYPSLYFYPNGKDGSYVPYNRPHTFEDLEEYIMSFIKKKITLPNVSFIRDSDNPMTYVLDTSLDEKMLIRIAYRLYWVTTIVKIDEYLRNKVSNDPDVTILLQYNNKTVWIRTTDEMSIVKQIVDALPPIEQIDLKKLETIRNQQRNGDEGPWVLFFSTQGADKLPLYLLKVSASTSLKFGEINCDKLGALCHSLQVNKAPAWGLFKPGGSYQKLFLEPTQELLDKSIAAYNLHTLSASDFKKILEDDVTTWVLIIAPDKTSWQHMVEPFMDAAIEFKEVGISFGIMSCSAHTDDHCRSVSGNTAMIAVRERGKMHRFRGDIDKAGIVEFVDLIKDMDDFSLTEKQVLEISDAQSREHSWIVAFFPRHCAIECDELLHEMRIVSKRLRPLKFIRVGALWCRNEQGKGGFCPNVRSPTLRLYPLASGQLFTIPLQQLSRAPYILKWALTHIDDTIVDLDSESFYTNTEQQDGDQKPWVVYFHSPRCYKCYESYADFAIIANHLGKVINFGKVNCITERSVCQQEYITSYPYMRIFINRNERHPYRAVVNLPVTEYSQLWQDLQPHLKDYSEDILARFESFDMKSQYLRDEL